MKKIGFYVPSVGHHQIAFNVLTALNNYKNPNVDPLIFIDIPTVSIIPSKAAIFSAMEVFEYPGRVVCFNLDQASRLINMLGPERKIYYIQDLEYVHLQQKSYEQLAAIYRNPKLTLVTRSESYKKAIEDAWNVSVKVIPTIDVDEFLKV